MSAHHRSSIRQLFVAVASAIAIATSLLTFSPSAGATGLTWVQPTLPAGSHVWTGSTYGEGLFVAVGTDSTWGNRRIMTSANGVDWELNVDDVGEENLEGVAYGNDTFVAIGYGRSKVLSSADGKVWTDHSLNADPAAPSWWNSITFGAGLFVAVTYDGHTMWSTDGSTWTAGQIDKTNLPNWMSVTYASGMFVAVSRNGYVTTSTDGKIWTTPVLQLSNLGTLFQWAAYRITYGNGVFVVTGLKGYESGNNQSSYLYTGVESGGVITWTDRSAYLPASLVGSTFIMNTAYNGSEWVSLTKDSSSQNVIVTTSDLADPNTTPVWTTSASTTQGVWTSMTYAGGLLLAVNTDGVIMTAGSYTSPTTSTSTTTSTSAPTTTVATATTVPSGSSATSTVGPVATNLPETGGDSLTPVLAGLALIMLGAALLRRVRATIH